jgi:hypothetical protein
MDRIVFDNPKRCDQEKGSCAGNLSTDLLKTDAAPGRHCEERSDEAIQRARSAPLKG